jgi:hypothetical protein
LKLPQPASQTSNLTRPSRSVLSPKIKKISPSGPESNNIKLLNLMEKKQISWFLRQGLLVISAGNILKYFNGLYYAEMLSLES